MIEKLKTFWAKCKKIKHFELIVAGVFALIILAIYFSSFWTGTDDSNINSQKASVQASEYASYLENKLSLVLCEVEGAGKVTVMITLSSGMEYEYATNTETKTNTNGALETSVTTSTPIIINTGGTSQPIIVKEIYPKISGVVVVAGGAKDLGVKLALIIATETVLNVPTECIQILVGK